MRILFTAALAASFAAVSLPALAADCGSDARQREGLQDLQR